MHLLLCFHSIHLLRPNRDKRIRGRSAFSVSTNRSPNRDHQAQYDCGQAEAPHGIARIVSKRGNAGQPEFCAEKHNGHQNNRRRIALKRLRHDYRNYIWQSSALW